MLGKRDKNADRIIDLATRGTVKQLRQEGINGMSLRNLKSAVETRYARELQAVCSRTYYQHRASDVIVTAGGTFITAA